MATQMEPAPSKPCMGIISTPHDTQPATQPEQERTAAVAEPPQNGADLSTGGACMQRPMSNKRKRAPGMICIPHSQYAGAYGYYNSPPNDAQYWSATAPAVPWDIGYNMPPPNGCYGMVPAYSPQDGTPMPLQPMRQGHATAMPPECMPRYNMCGPADGSARVHLAPSYWAPGMKYPVKRKVWPSWSGAPMPTYLPDDGGIPHDPAFHWTMKYPPIYTQQEDCPYPTSNAGVQQSAQKRAMPFMRPARRSAGGFQTGVRGMPYPPGAMCPPNRLPNTNTMVVPPVANYNSNSSIEHNRAVQGSSLNRPPTNTPQLDQAAAGLPPSLSSKQPAGPQLENGAPCIAQLHASFAAELPGSPSFDQLLAADPDGDELMQELQALLDG